MQFYKNDGFQSAKEWIETLMIDSNEHNVLIVEYIQKILELCGPVVYNLGDLDMMPFSSEMLQILTNNKKV